jgi:formate hydrogenlyase transcriptional activator
MVDPARFSLEHLASLLEFETLIAELSSRFINLPPAEVDRAIEDALRRVCELLGIDLAVLWQWSGAAPSIVTPTHFYPAQKGLQPPGPLRQADYPWVADQMAAGRTVALSSLEELPEAAAVDRESARLSGIRSSLTLPLSVGGQAPVGALAFNTVHSEREWPDVVVKRLRLVAQVLGNALARKRDDHALRESKERLSLAADAAEAGLWNLDYGTGEFWVTERARAIFGFSPDEVITIDRLRTSVHPDDWVRVDAVIERAARTGERVAVDYRIIVPGDRRVRWIASTGRLHRTAGSESARLMGVSIDVTERTRGEYALRASEARLAAAADLAGLGFYEIDLAARTVFVDDRFREVCGIPPEREQDLSVLEFWIEHLHPDDRQLILDKRQELHAGRLERLSMEYRYLHPAEGEKWIHHQARVARRDPDGRTVRTYGVLRDTTDRRRREEALQHSLAEIERLKDRLQAESDYLKAEIRVVHSHGEVTGQSAAIQKVLRQVAQVASTGSTVLVRGETGTGKELVARAIHRLSPRQGRLMVTVNCAALPSGLVESELFGREKGAYTGALTRQVGRFEVADGSTLFLDEVGELSLEVQAKLLRALETGEFERLGSSRTVKVDVRLIAATNRDLLEDVRRGRFREDLYYRLCVFPIRVPPLRERVEDIPALVWAFLEEFSSRMGKRITRVPRATMDALQRHSWPGNVRELRNVVEHGAIVATGESLRVPMLDDDAPGAATPRTLADAEREHVLRALERAGWRIKGSRGAAAALGLKPSTLYTRMKKLGIRTPRQTEDGSA